mmetsp:Transcript_21073/g.56219  ORF Transcript_21073/g.56219 Transcript_21073/m.56219 type:complete len:114 (-) Transcript_21073:512-853(-)
MLLDPRTMGSTLREDRKKYLVQLKNLYVEYAKTAKAFEEAKKVSTEKTSEPTTEQSAEPLASGSICPKIPSHPRATLGGDALTDEERDDQEQHSQVSADVAQPDIDFDALYGE